LIAALPLPPGLLPLWCWPPCPTAALLLTLMPPGLLPLWCWLPRLIAALLLSLMPLTRPLRRPVATPLQRAGRPLKAFARQLEPPVMLVVLTPVRSATPCQMLLPLSVLPQPLVQTLRVWRRLARSYPHPPK